MWQQEIPSPPHLTPHSCHHTRLANKQTPPPRPNQNFAVALTRPQQAAPIFIFFLFRTTMVLIFGARSAFSKKWVVVVQQQQQATASSPAKGASRTLHCPHRRPLPNRCRPAKIGCISMKSKGMRAKMRPLLLIRKMCRWIWSEVWAVLWAWKAEVLMWLWWIRSPSGMLSYQWRLLSQFDRGLVSDWGPRCRPDFIIFFSFPFFQRMVILLLRCYRWIHDFNGLHRQDFVQSWCPRS